ncbi:MAG TPA: DUF932 domain-containing protein [Thermoanaerobaculia bacterium]|nr:DUF932 domain-containing protein [Thermoanaerobaculia bacterium]
MAHQIETHGTRAAALFARTDPWHRLGTTVAGAAFTAEDAMTLGHLGGWNVRKAPVTATEIHDDGVTSLEVPGATFDTAGSLRGGRQVFVTMRLPEHLSIGGSDRVDLNIAALNSHDGSSAFRVLITPVRVVCANTQHAALRNHLSSWSIRHTRNAKAAVQAARDTLGLTFAYVEAFEAEAERMINTSVTDAAFFELVQNLFPSPSPEAPARTRNAARRRQASLAHLWHDAATQSGIAGTAWAAYQSVVEYVDHFAPVRDKADAAMARALRLLTTDEPARIKARAWTALTPA